jgi:hypothetical protein
MTLFAAHSAAIVVAAAQPGGQGPEFGSSGPVALALLVGLLIAVVFLVKSMSKHLKRVPASFDQPESTTQAPRADEPHDEPNP